MNLRTSWNLLKHRFQRPSGRLTIGSEAYRRHIADEIEHYEDKYGAGGVELSPASWDEVHNRGYCLIAERTGLDPHQHMMKRLPGKRMLSLGSGAGGLEIHYAREAPGGEIVGMDVNPGLVESANIAAQGLPVRFEAADLNTARLPAAAFDIVFCHASLHHLLELEHVMEQMRAALRPGGALVVHDVISRNGHLMRPETKRVATEIWRTLPERLRVNHTGYASPRVDEEIWDMDTRSVGMECIRSEDIPKLLDQYFRREIYFPYMTLARRFLNTMYGPNYRLDQDEDRAIFDRIWSMDIEHLDRGTLPGETLFAIYRCD